MQEILPFFPWLLIAQVAVITLGAIIYRVLYKENCFGDCVPAAYTNNEDTLVILCSKDEDPNRLKEAIESVLENHADLIVVDDASKFPVIIQTHNNNPNFLGVLRNEDNKGKKLSQNRAVSRLEQEQRFSKYRFVVSVDSDTILSPGAIQYAKWKFVGNIAAVVGDIGVKNSWTVDALYWQSFNIMRAIATLVGQVPVCSGAFTVYRAELFSKIIKESSKRKINGGEDRYLTYLLLKMGWQTAYAYKAQAMTYTPKGFAFIKQQLRWQRSFWRGLVYSWDAYKKNWFLAVLNIFGAFGRISSIFFFIFFWYLLFTGSYSWAVVILLMIVVHCQWAGLYGVLIKNNLTMFMLPFWGLYSFFVIAPLNVWALLTIKNDG